MALLNYTTKIPAEQTIGEIQKKLSSYGVNAMMTEYDGPHVSAVSFRMSIEGRQMSFKLPCNWRAVRAVFDKQGITLSKLRLRKTGGGLDEQAIRTAWRIILVWVEAQIALVEVNMTTIPQVFLPYMVVKGGQTLSEKMLADPQFLLGSGEQ